VVVNQSTITASTWTLYTWTFIVPATGTNAPYKGVYPILVTLGSDPADVFYIDAVRFEDLTNAPVELLAPPPTGDRPTDTANLQRLVDLAQSTRGTIVLRAGIYAADLVTTKTIIQPRIVGQGKKTTKIDGTIKWRGVSGQFSGGWMSRFAMTGTHAGEAAIEFNGVCDVHWDELIIEGTYATGLLFHNETPGDFAEVNNGVANIYYLCTNALEYRVAAGGALRPPGAGATDRHPVGARLRNAERRHPRETGARAGAGDRGCTRLTPAAQVHRLSRRCPPFLVWRRYRNDGPGQTSRMHVNDVAAISYVISHLSGLGPAFPWGTG